MNSTRSSSSNCTFMELKQAIKAAQSAKFGRSNCTFMELKYDYDAGSNEKARSNCTFMELKYYEASRNYQYFSSVLIVPLWN